MDELPEEMVEQADRLGFPLILLPNDVGFDDILNQVLTDILNRQAAVLARAEEAHRALVQVVLAGGGLDEVTAEVAPLLDVAVAAVDGGGRVLAAAGPPDQVTSLRESIAREGRRCRPPGRPVRPSGCRRRPPPVGRAGARRDDGLGAGRSRAATTTAGSSPTARPA